MSKYLSHNIITYFYPIKNNIPAFIKDEHGGIPIEDAVLFGSLGGIVYMGAKAGNFLSQELQYIADVIKEARP